MAFKQNPNKKPRWEELSKTALIKTVKTLSARQTRLLNQIAKLEKVAAERSPLNPLSGTELDDLLERQAPSLLPWEVKS